MKVKYDNIADAMYMRYSTNKISSTKIVNDSIIDFDSKGWVVGVEIIWVEKKFEENNILLKQKTWELEYA